jgi:hypothetical protein
VVGVEAVRVARATTASALSHRRPPCSGRSPGMLCVRVCVLEREREREREREKEGGRGRRGESERGRGQEKKTSLNTADDEGSTHTHTHTHTHTRVCMRSVCTHTCTGGAMVCAPVSGRRCLRAWVRMCMCVCVVVVVGGGGGRNEREQERDRERETARCTEVESKSRSQIEVYEANREWSGRAAVGQSRVRRVGVESKRSRVEK